MREKIEKEFPKIEDEGNEKLEFQDLDSIMIQEVEEGDFDYENAIEISAYQEGTDEDVEKKVKARLVDENWWFKEKWNDKGIPEEQISIEINHHKIDIYNWGGSLQDEQCKEIYEVLKQFAFINNGKILEKNRYILIDNEKGPTHPYSKKEQYGDATEVRFDKALHLFAGVLSVDENGESYKHRIPGASVLEGTLIHELFHSIGVDIENEWREKFGENVEKGRKTPGGSISYWKPKKDFQCIGDFVKNSPAEYSPAEDICESMVAVLRSKNPKELIGQKKLDFLREKVLNFDTKNEEKNFMEIQELKGDDIILPRVESPVKFKKSENDLEFYN